MHAPAYDVFFARLLSCSPSETGQVNEQTLMTSSDLTRSEVKISTGQTRRWGYHPTFWILLRGKEV